MTFPRAVSLTEPFALLENMRAGSRAPSSMLFWGAKRHIAAYDGVALRPALDALDTERKAGRFVCGYLTYEAGYFLAEKRSFAMAKAETLALPLLSFHAFSHRMLLDERQVRELLETSPVPVPCAVYSIEQSESEEHYRSKLARIQSYIGDGETYQVNYAWKYRFAFQGSPLALYRELRERQRVEYGAYLHFREARVVSLSPELFLRKEGERLISKPMKGTARRSSEPAEDDSLARALRSDPKTLAEHVMIVDLLRNDIGRVAKSGTVAVRDMCEVQTFESVHQMVSTVEGEVGADSKVGDLLARLFPCGSITGAPKLRTMEIIEELEDEPRGVYTGAIGYVSPDNNFCFNVPIRTIVSTEEGRGELGVGSGIVAESVASTEFAECQLKGRFLTGLGEKFQLIASMRYRYGEVAPDFIDLHLARLERSAAFFGFRWRREAVVAAIEEAIASANGGASKVRLLLHHGGRTQVSVEPIGEPPPAGRWLSVSPDRVDSSSVFQYHKTTVRTHYERALEVAAAEGAYETLFLNERLEVAEAARHNIFVVKSGEWLTPPVNAGILNGIQRHLILSDALYRAREVTLTLDDVVHADQVFLTNAVRGVVEVRLSAPGQKEP